MTVVSVVMPTFNAAKWVAAAIDNVFSQTYPYVELIVVDDGSQDDTVSVVRQTLTRRAGTSWKVIELGENRGPSAARNVGLGAASGAWVQFFDSDDLISPRKFERQMAFCAKAPAEVTAVYSPYRRCFLEKGKLSWAGPLGKPDMEGRAPVMCLVSPVRPLHGAGLARRSALEQIGGFDETLRFWECEEVTFRLARAGRLAPAPSPEPLYLWRMHREAIYIGGEDARYRSTGVALGWLAQVLKATGGRSLDQLGLSEDDRRLLLDESTLWARLLYAQDRTAFHQYLAMARTLDPDIAPTKPAYAAMASRCFGYEAAERIAKLGRQPKTFARRVLERTGLRPQNMFDWG